MRCSRRRRRARRSSHTRPRRTARCHWCPATASDPPERAGICSKTADVGFAFVGGGIDLVDGEETTGRGILAAFSAGKGRTGADVLTEPAADPIPYLAGRGPVVDILQVVALVVVLLGKENVFRVCSHGLSSVMAPAEVTRHVRPRVNIAVRADHRHIAATFLPENVGEGGAIGRHMHSLDALRHEARIGV